MKTEIDTSSIVYEFGKLKSVIYHSDSSENERLMLSAIQFIFEKGDVYHEALADTDEISCASFLLNQYDNIKDVTKLELWSKCIDKMPLWIWKLTNQQGYNDAIQYEFQNNIGKNIKIQLIVEASEIQIIEI